jgi:hypothetical protein
MRLLLFLSVIALGASWNSATAQCIEGTVLWQEVSTNMARCGFPGRATNGTASDTYFLKSETKIWEYKTEQNGTATRYAESSSSFTNPFGNSCPYGTGCTNGPGTNYSEINIPWLSGSDATNGTLYTWILRQSSGEPGQYNPAYYPVCLNSSLSPNPLVLNTNVNSSETTDTTTEYEDNNPRPTYMVCRGSTPDPDHFHGLTAAPLAPPTCRRLPPDLTLFPSAIGMQSP